MLYWVSNGEPAANANMRFPSANTIGVSVGVASVNSDGGVDVAKSYPMGPVNVSVGTNRGVDYKGYPVSLNYVSTETNNSTYLVVQSSTGMYVKRVDVQEIVTQTSTAILNSTNIKRFTNSTFANGYSTGYVKSVDSIQYYLGVNVSTPAGAGVSVNPLIKASSNMPEK